MSCDSVCYYRRPCQFFWTPTGTKSSSDSSRWRVRCSEWRTASCHTSPCPLSDPAFLCTSQFVPDSKSTSDPDQKAETARLSEIIGPRSSWAWRGTAFWGLERGRWFLRSPRVRLSWLWRGSVASCVVWDHWHCRKMLSGGGCTQWFLWWDCAASWIVRSPWSCLLWGNVSNSNHSDLYCDL